MNVRYSWANRYDGTTRQRTQWFMSTVQPETSFLSLPTKKWLQVELYLTSQAQVMSRGIHCLTVFIYFVLRWLIVRLFVLVPGFLQYTQRSWLLTAGSAENFCLVCHRKSAIKTIASGIWKKKYRNGKRKYGPMNSASKATFRIV